MRFLIAFLLLSSSLYGQYDTRVTYGLQYPRLKSTIGLVSPTDTTSTEPGSYAVKNGIAYYRDATKWQSITSVSAQQTKTIAQLRALPSTDTSPYFDNDRGGDLWIYDPSNDGVDDDGTRLSNNRVRAFLGDVHAKWWGTTGNGVAVDGRKIQKALDYCKVNGGNVLLEYATYLADTTITIPRGVFLKGPFPSLNINTATIKRANNMNYTLLQVGSGSDGNAFNGIDGIKIDGNSANQTTEQVAIKFTKQYIGSRSDNFFVVDNFGHAIEFEGGFDIRLDNVWVLGNKSSDGYAIVAHPVSVAPIKDGNINCGNLYVEYSIKTNNPLLSVYDPANASLRSTGILLRDVISATFNELHGEYLGGLIELQNCFAININHISGFTYGNLNNTINQGVVRLYDANAVQTINVPVGMGTAYTLGDSASNIRWVSVLNGTGNNNFPQGDRLSTNPVLTGYKAANIGGNPAPGRNILPSSDVANNLSINEIGAASPASLYFKDANLALMGFLKSSGAFTHLGSRKNQLSDKNFITLDSYGNAGDAIRLSDPLYLGTRADANNLLANSFYIYQNTPVISRGSNLFDYINSTSLGSGAPASVARFIGQEYYDVTNRIFYKALSTSTLAGWNIEKRESGVKDAIQFDLTDITYTVPKHSIRYSDFVMSVGSLVNQSSFKSFLDIKSYGNAGDVIVTNAPIQLHNRTAPSNLLAGQILSYNGVPSYSAGSNKVYALGTTFSGPGYPFLTPEWTGQTYLNTVNNSIYFSTGTTGISDWKRLLTSVDSASLSGSLLASNNTWTGSNTYSLPVTISHSDNAYGSGLVVRNTNTGTTSFSSLVLQNSASAVKAQFAYIPSNYINSALANSIIFTGFGTSQMIFKTSGDHAAFPDINFQSGNQPIALNIKGSNNSVEATRLDIYGYNPLTLAGLQDGNISDSILTIWNKVVRKVPMTYLGPWRPIGSDFDDIEFSAGRVRIGSGTPASALDVDGQVIANKGTLSTHLVTKGQLDSLANAGLNIASNTDSLGGQPAAYYAPRYHTTRTVTTSTTLVIGDIDNTVETNVASANEVTIPPYSSVPFPLGTRIGIRQRGVGQTTVAPGVGVTFRVAGGRTKIHEQNITTSWEQVELNVWVGSGDMDN